MMKTFEEIKVLLREKSGKKLQTFTVLTALLIACIVFISVLLLNSYSKLKLLDQYIREVPVIVEDREEELYTRSAVFEEDVIARGELGVKVFQEETDLSAEEKLEKIITQKWIANFPEGKNAWAEFRRTGYPRLFPVLKNDSQGEISTEDRVRRLPFPTSEERDNPAGYAEALKLLGGPDNGATRVFWDIKKGNF